MTLDGSMDKAKPVAYIETSVVSYLTARPSRDVVVAAYQEVTREWWRNAPERFDLVASDSLLRKLAWATPMRLVPAWRSLSP